MKILALILSFISFQLSFAQQKPDKMTLYDYDKAWKEAKEFEDKGLPESALKVVNIIYEQAKKEQNASQLVKAIIHQLKLTDYKEENAFVKNLNRLRDEAKIATFPTKPLLHSMLAEMYWQYYQNNRYRFNERSELTNVQQDDIETWGLNKIIEETFQQYKLSLEESDRSKATSIELFQEVLYSGNKLGRSYRPTLYDFLAHRALDFSSGEEASITQPAHAFVLDKEDYLFDAPAFVKLPITSKDTFSMKYFAIQLLQDIIQFHLNDKDPEALVDVDLKRLSFVKENLILSNKEEAYRDALEQLEKKYITHPISTQVTYLIANTYVEKASLYKPLQSDNHKWDYKKAFEIGEAAKKRFPNSDGAIRCENMQDDMRTKSISASIEENNIPGGVFRARVEYRNFTDLHYRIIKTNRDEVLAQRKKWERNYKVDREQKFIEYFAAKTPMKSGKFVLPDDKDYQQHNIEVKLDALPAGEYMVLLSHRPDFVTATNGLAYAFTRITNISYLHRSLKDGTTDCYVLHRQSGEPLANVSAEVYSNQYNSKKQSYESIKVGSFTSDAKGYLKIPFLKNENHRNFSINFKLREDEFSTVPIDSRDYYGGTLYQSKRYEEGKNIRTFFFLDRAIYRPGQTIYFKGLVVDTDGKTSEIKTKLGTTVTLYDVNHQERGEVQVTTNEYGTFSGTFTAPSSGLTGQMSLEDSYGSGSVYFSVEEYKRPKFEVGFEPVKGTFRLDETISSEGFARAYSGANIDGASVSYRVVRTARFPYWWWCRWGYYPTAPEMEIINGITKTDEQGKFKIDFQAIPDKSIDPSSDPTFDYTVHADVTDINGETHSNTATISVAYKALQVGVSIGNINTDQLPKEAKEFSISTTNLASQFEPARGSVKIYELKAPAKAFRARQWEQPDRKLYTREQYAEYFPVDLYEDENNKFKWERAKEVFNLNFDTSDKKIFTIDDLSKWKSGEYVLEIKALDTNGQEVKEVSYFTVFAPSDKTIPTPQVHYFQPVKMTVEPGDKAVFATGTSDKKIQVLYEIERDGILLSKEWITLSNEQRLFEIPIREEHRGNLGVHYTFIKNNRLYSQSTTVSVPYTNKVLDISFESFRDKLQPGQQEQWKILIKGKSADKVAAEMVATLYDESLDEFRSNSWYATFFGSQYSKLGWSSTNGFNTKPLTEYNHDWNSGHERSPSGAYFDSFNWFNYSFYQYYYGNRSFRAGGVKKELSYSVMSKSAPAEAEMAMDDAAPMRNENVNDSSSVVPSQTAKPETNPVTKEDFSQVKVRTNFNETAFFYPHLQTNANGEIIINFTIPEALTRWKMLGFAHTPDLKSGSIINHLVTQKDVMVVPNQPRFFRENDKMIFQVKVNSLVDTELTGQAQLEFFDALTMKSIDVEMKNVNKNKPFALKSRQSTNLEWSIEIPEGLQAITYRVVAKAGNFSDGEEMTIPVVTNRMLVTETLPLPIRGKQTKEFKFDKLLNTKSKTLRNHRFTLEFTSNPAWYAIQALPYLMEYPYDCVEQTFSKFYANSIASHIANSNPRIKQVFDTWKNIQPDALLSNLEKNQELKSALLEETPWVLHAKDESQRKRNVGLLFDLNRMANEQDRALDKITKAQNSSGGFSWFPGFPEDRYMTQHIISGMGHLDVLGVKSVREESRTWSMITSGVGYLDRQIKDDYDRLKALAKKKAIKLEDKHIGYNQIHYLYTRSYFKDIKVNDDVKEAFNYYLGQAKKYWLTKNLYMEGMTCLALHRFDDKSTTAAMIKSFSERALRSEEMGMYWKNDYGYYWYQAPIETQALMIEVYDEVANDVKAVEELKVWLLKQKQTQDWKTTKATTEACYALLRRGTDALVNTKMVDIKVGNEVVDPTKREDTKVEAGTGYFKTAWQASEIKSDMGKITISKTDDGVAWGAAYWQYFEQLDKITPAETPLKLKKELFKQQNTDRGPVLTPITEKSPLQIGDLVKVRIELRVDREMEYVHLKDMRAAGLEPTSTLSTYRYQDGLYYYESTRDLATNFFIGYLSKGTYVFEYDLRVSQKGDFSNGVTNIQCMYAPEFASHSEGIRINVR
ncbi:MAG TPA: MG2 domain-containing protein [Chryseolinea sp.]|nr:MG2 domain-containing protein [Chryseolinea sp.]HPM31471.1 MG2 domain-containing protein [Chryseolinea sp.]